MIIPDLSLRPFLLIFFFFNDTATTEIYTLSLHDALPIYPRARADRDRPLRGRGRAELRVPGRDPGTRSSRSEEHTSELQSLTNLVCRLLLEKKKDSQFRLTSTQSAHPVSNSQGSSAPLAD